MPGPINCQADSLARCACGQPGIPREGDGDDASVVQRDDQEIARHPNLGREGTLSARRSTHAMPTGMLPFALV